MEPGSCPHCHEQQDLLSNVKFEDDFSLKCTGCNKVIFATSPNNEVYNVVPKGGWVNPTYNQNNQNTTQYNRGFNQNTPAGNGQTANTCSNTHANNMGGTTTPSNTVSRYPSSVSNQQNGHQFNQPHGQM